jgi:hypothetical protein
LGTGEVALDSDLELEWVQVDWIREPLGEGGGEAWVEAQVSVGAEQVELDGDVAGKVLAQGSDQLDCAGGDRVEHDSRGLPGAQAEGGADTHELVAHGPSKGEESGGGSEDGPEEVRVIGGVYVVDERAGEPLEPEVRMGGNPYASHDGQLTGLGARGVGHQGVGEGVTSNATFAGSDSLTGCLVEPAFPCDQGRRDDVIVRHDRVDCHVRGIDEALEVTGGGAVVGVHEQAKQAPQQALVAGEFIPVENAGLG